MDVKQKLIKMKSITRALWLPAALISLIMLVDSFTGLFWEYIEIFSAAALGCEFIAVAGIFMAVNTVRTAKSNNIDIGANGLITDGVMRQVIFIAAFSLDWLLHIE